MSRRRSRGRSPGGGEITVSEADGIRYLHFGTPWVQGAMRARRPTELVLDYARHMMSWMLFRDGPLRIAQFGLGAGSLVRWTHHHLSDVSTTVVELSPAVAAVARSQFGLPDEDERYELLLQDANDFATHPGRRVAYNVLQVDVFDAEARGPAIDSEVFYAGCAALLDESGVAVFNLFGEVPSYEKNLRRIAAAFDGRVLVLPPVEAGNVIVLGFGPQAGPWTWRGLFERADEIETRYGLRARGWVEGLRKSADRGIGAAWLITGDLPPADA